MPATNTSPHAGVVAPPPLDPESAFFSQTPPAHRPLPLTPDLDPPGADRIGLFAGGDRTVPHTGIRHQARAHPARRPRAVPRTLVAATSRRPSRRPTRRSRFVDRPRRPLDGRESLGTRPRLDGRQPVALSRGRASWRHGGRACRAVAASPEPRCDKRRVALARPRPRPGLRRGDVRPPAHALHARGADGGSRETALAQSRCLLDLPARPGRAGVAPRTAHGPEHDGAVRGHAARRRAAAFRRFHDIPDLAATALSNLGAGPQLGGHGSVGGRGRPAQGRGPAGGAHGTRR